MAYLMLIDDETLVYEFNHNVLRRGKKPFYAIRLRHGETVQWIRVRRDSSSQPDVWKTNLWYGGMQPYIDIIEKCYIQQRGG